jgi:hypothetical protein
MDLNFSYYDDEDIDRIAHIKLLEDKLVLMQGERDEAMRLLKAVEDMKHEIDILRAALAKSNAERDEARREIVLLLNGCCSWSKLTQEIKKRGWDDCFRRRDGFGE